MGIVIMLAFFTPTVVLSDNDWLPPTEGPHGGWLKDTVGEEYYYRDPLTGEFLHIIHCPSNPWNIYCQIEVPINYCGIPDLPGYVTSDDDYYYFHAGFITTTQAYVNLAEGTASMRIPKAWLDAIWPPDTTH